MSFQEAVSTSLREIRSEFKVFQEQQRSDHRRLGRSLSKLRREIRLKRSSVLPQVKEEAVELPKPNQGQAEDAVEPPPHSSPILPASFPFTSSQPPAPSSTLLSPIFVDSIVVSISPSLPLSSVTTSVSDSVPSITSILSSLIV